VTTALADVGLMDTFERPFAILVNGMVGVGGDSQLMLFVEFVYVQLVHQIAGQHASDVDERVAITDPETLAGFERTIVRQRRGPTLMG
jgi:hypothetical protein